MKPEDFRYVDFRVLSSKSENFVGPDRGREKGKSRTRMTAELGLPSEADPSNMAYVDLSVTLDGFLGEGREDSDRSFTASSTCRHAFKAEEAGHAVEADAPDFLRWFLVQCYPVQLEKLRQMAHAMGFKGVNPDLGGKLSRFELSRAEPDEATQAPVKRQKPKPKTLK